MPTTPVYGWPVPGLEDQNNVPADLLLAFSAVEQTFRQQLARPLLRIYAVQDQDLPSNADVTMTCTAQVNEGGFGTGSGSWARVVPIDGWYRCAAQYQWRRPSSTAYGRVQIRAGSTIIAENEGGLGPNHDLSVMCEVTRWLYAGSEIGFYGRQSSGAPLGAKGGFTYCTWMSIEYLRGAS